MLSAGQGTRWEPNSSGPSIAGRGVSLRWPPLPYLPGCSQPSPSAGCPADGAFAFRSPMEIPCSPPPKNAGAEPVLRAGCLEPPEPRGSGAEGEASGRRRVSRFHPPAQLWTSIFPLIGTGWGCQRPPPARATGTAVTLVLARMRHSAPRWDLIFFPSPLPYNHLCKNKTHFPGGSLEELPTVASGRWPCSCPCLSASWG